MLKAKPQPASHDIPDEHIRLANRVVGRCARQRPFEKDELESEALKLLWDAYLEYDPSEEVPLEGFLYVFIRWGLIDFCDKQAGVKRAGKNLAVYARAEERLLAQANYSEPTDSEIAEAMSAPETVVADVMTAADLTQAAGQRLTDTANQTPTTGAVLAAVGVDLNDYPAEIQQAKKWTLPFKKKDDKGLEPTLADIVALKVEQPLMRVRQILKLRQELRREMGRKDKGANHPKAVTPAMIARRLKNGAAQYFQVYRPSQQGESLDDKPTIESLFEAAKFETKLTVQAILAQMSPDYREPLLLHHGVGLSMKELAKELGITEEGAKTRVHRGRQIFKKLYEQRGGKKEN